jgi:glycosyltransferase involved in cell wall biosynthesis
MTRVAFVARGMLMGGLETFLLSLGHFLQKNGFDVTIVTTETTGVWFEKIHEAGLKSLYIDGMQEALALDHIAKTGKVLKDSKFDIVFMNTTRHGHAAIEMLPDEMAVVSICHSDDDADYKIALVNSEICNAVIGVSHKLAKELQQRGAKCPVIEIPNGVRNVDIGKYELRDFRAPLLRLIFVGRLDDKTKGILRLPDILKLVLDKVPNVSLDIVGDGSDYNALKEKFDLYGLDKNVTFWGMQDCDKVQELLGRSHFLLFSSNNEGYGLVLAEAQMCGCIPIAFDLPDITEFIIKNDETGVIIPHGDVTAMAAAVITLAENPIKAQIMSKLAMGHAHENLSLDIMGKKYIQFINEVLECKKYPLQKKRSLLDPIYYADKCYDLIHVWQSVNETKEMLIYWEKLLLQRIGISTPLKEKGIKKVAIFGTRMTASYLYKDLTLDGMRVVAFMDNDKDKHGKEIYGVKVYSTEWLVDPDHKVDAIICSVESAYDVEIIKQLKSIVKYEGVVILSWKELVSQYRSANG